MKLRIVLILLVITLLVIVPVYAQDATAEATAAANVETAATIEAGQPETHPVAGVPETSESNNPAPGATVLVLLVGLGAVGLVGFTALMRENYKPSQE